MKNPPKMPADIPRFQTVQSDHKTYVRTAPDSDLWISIHDSGIVKTAKIRLDADGTLKTRKPYWFYKPMLQDRAALFTDISPKAQKALESMGIDWVAGKYQLPELPKSPIGKYTEATNRTTEKMRAARQEPEPKQKKSRTPSGDKSPKDLAKDLGVEPGKVRKMLRTTYQNHSGRWAWSKAEYEKVLKELKNA